MIFDIFFLKEVISEKDVLQLKTMFEKYDKDGDGHIDVKEFLEALETKDCVDPLVTEENFLQSMCLFFSPRSM